MFHLFCTGKYFGHNLFTLLSGYFSCHMQYKIHVIGQALKLTMEKMGRFKTTKYGFFNVNGWMHLGSIVFIIIEILWNWLSRESRQIITQTIRHKASGILLFCEDCALFWFPLFGVYYRWKGITSKKT